MIGSVTVLIIPISLVSMHSLIFSATGIAHMRNWRSQGWTAHKSCTEPKIKIIFFFTLHLYPHAPTCVDEGGQSYILMMESYTWQPSICGAGKTRKICEGKLAFGKLCQPLRILQGIWSEFPDCEPVIPEKDQLSTMKRKVAPGMVAES